MRASRRAWAGAGVVALLGAALPALADEPVRCFGRRPTIVGTRGRDHLVGTQGSDVIVGLGSDDLIQGRGGADLICGGLGADELYGGEGRDRVDGGRQVDLVFGRAGADLLYAGGTGPYHFGDDRLFGGRGGDRLAGDGAPNQLYGGPGDDELVGNGAEFECECETSFVERLDGGSGDDSLTGGVLAGDNIDGQYFVPGPGDDTVDSGRPEEEPGSEDCGLAGERPCIGPMHGRDVVDYREAAEAVTVDLAGGTAGGEGSDTLIGIDAVLGSPFDDVIAGDDTANYLYGADGNDRVSGGASNDFLAGGIGDDGLDGGDGLADEAHGDEGNDTCVEAEYVDECEA